MISLKTYTSLFILFLIIFILFFGSPISDSSVVLGFFLSTVFHIFTFEQKPTKGLDNPKVHYYQKSRVNIYSYIIISFTGFATFLFYIITTLTDVRIGFTSIGLWLLIIFGSLLAQRYSEKRLQLDLIKDFAEQQMGLDYELVDQMIEYIDEYGIKPEDYKIMGKKFDEVKLPKIKKIIDLYWDYINNNSNESEYLLSEEIEEINK